MPDPTAFLDYLTAHPWAGWLLLGLISLVATKKSQVDAWAESNPRVAGVMKLLRGFGIDPWLALQGLSLIVRGRLPVTKATPPADAAPPTPRSGPPPAAVALLFAGALGISGALPACSPAATPEARGAQAAQVSRLAYNAAAVAVQALVTVNTTWMDAVSASGDPAAAQAVLPTARRVSTALESAVGALARARQYLEIGESEAKVRQQLREAVDFADVAVELLGATGRPLPDKALDALSFLRGFLGAAPAGAS